MTPVAVLLRRHCARGPHKRGGNARTCSSRRLGVRERRERRDVKARALPVDHSERGRADRAGGTEDRHAARRHGKTGSGSHPSSRYATGITKNRLSKRSRMPPCPGMIRELSFTPASRLSSDSKRSPVCAADADERPEQQRAPRREAQMRDRHEHAARVHIRHEHARDETAHRARRSSCRGSPTA